jgi:iron complex transport system substrate-binding protein
MRWKMSKYMKCWLLAAVCVFLLLLCTGLAAEDARMVVDSRGVAVQLPSEINRVVTISDGLVEGVMTVLGVQDKLVGLGSGCLQKNFNYTYETVSNQSFTYADGMNPVLYLNPWIKDLPLIADEGVNFEALAGPDPDVVIMRIGDCTFWTNDVNDENVQKSIKTIESLGIPVVVLYGPNCFDEPDIFRISDEISIVGQVFGEEEKAEKMAEYLEAQVDLIKERTENATDEEKPTVLVFGLSPSARKQGGAGVIFGTDTIESYLIEDLVHARNAYQDEGYFKVLNAVQVLALNPEVIVLATAAGYHPPRELYDAPYYQNLQELDAVKNKRVSALPWTPCNCVKRQEYPIDVMVIAKAAYPDRFQDIDLAEWLLDFYQNVYGVDPETAEELRSAQWMDWAAEN